MLIPAWLIALDYSSVMKSSVALIVVAGFVLAVLIGSIAWFNAKKPAGWENAETPDWVPKIGEKKTQDSSSEQ
jgi:hypothetical protein